MNIINFGCIMFRRVHHKLIVVAGIILFALNVGAQNKNIPCHLGLESFKLDHEPDMSLFMDSYDWFINQTHIDRKKDRVDFDSHYPGFDTIYFSNNEGQDTVITRFKPGKIYRFTIGAGMAGFDVHEVQSEQKSDPKTRKNPVLDLKIEDLPVNDTLVGFFTDFYGGEALGTYITKNGIVSLGLPVKYTNADYLAYIVIGKLVRPLIPGEKQKKLVWPKIQLHARENADRMISVHTRFLYGEKLLAIYNVNTKKLKLEIK